MTDFIKSLIRLKGQSHENVCELITRDDCFDLNQGSPAGFKILKSPCKKLQYFRRETLVVKFLCVYLVSVIWCILL
jgi:hypothetical protein